MLCLYIAIRAMRLQGHIEAGHALSRQVELYYILAAFLSRFVIRVRVSTLTACLEMICYDMVCWVKCGIYVRTVIYLKLDIPLVDPSHPLCNTVIVVEEVCEGCSVAVCVPSFSMMVCVPFFSTTVCVPSFSTMVAAPVRGGEAAVGAAVTCPRWSSAASATTPWTCTSGP